MPPPTFVLCSSSDFAEQTHTATFNNRFSTPGSHLVLAPAQSPLAGGAELSHDLPTTAPKTGKLLFC